MITWAEAILEFENAMRLEKNFSKNSVMAYLRDIRKLQNWAETLLQKESPAQIQLADLQEILYQKFPAGSNPRSQSRWISSVRSFFKFLAEEELLPDSPAVLLELPKLGLYLPDTLDLDEIDQLVKIIPRGEAIGERNFALIEVLYGCGLRISEALALRVSDLFLEEKFLRVLGKGNKMRLVPLTDFTAEALKNYLAFYRPAFVKENYSTDLLFLNTRGRGLSRVYAFLLIKELAFKAGVEKNVSPHTFRHSYATHMLQNGADLRFIQEILGHSSITTTEIYTHLQTEDLRQTILTYHPRNQ